MVPRSPRARTRRNGTPAGDASRSEEKFEVWAHIKFEGPGFPHGNAAQKNAISVDRVVALRQRG
jgi:hypothetical protein